MVMALMGQAACGGEGAPTPALPESEAPEERGDLAEADGPSAEPARDEPTDEPDDKEDDGATDHLAELRAELAQQAEAEEERWTDELRDHASALAEAEFSSLSEGLNAVLASEHRTPGNPARDPERRPTETLAFFGLSPEMKVLEIGPGAGWYTEILAPLLAPQGELWVTAPDVPPSDEDSYPAFFRDRLDFVLGRSAELFGGVGKASYDPADPDLGLSEEFDAALLIRGMHNFVRRDQLDAWLSTVYDALRPGAVFGVVQHRAPGDADPEASAETGYLPEDWVVSQVESAGFELEERSEINANPDDTADHEAGVWTLPPSLRLGDQDREKYEAIGESDRMTLRFVKPE